MDRLPKRFEEEVLSKKGIVWDKLYYINPDIIVAHNGEFGIYTTEYIVEAIEIAMIGLIELKDIHPVEICDSGIQYGNIYCNTSDIIESLLKIIESEYGR